MPNGGKLILETGNGLLDEDYAGMHSDVRPGRYVMIAVSDTGTGIPAAMLDKVFDPFFTTKGPGKGTGLGLSMVYGFVKQSDGHIKIYSEEGHGTTIKMYLPPGSRRAQVAAEAGTRRRSRAATKRSWSSRTTSWSRTMSLTQTAFLGYITLAAANARGSAGRHRGRPRIRPAVHRRDHAGRHERPPARHRGAAAAQPGLKMLYTSGYTENAIIHHGRLDSGVLLLAKPYRRSDLARMIRKALDN